MRLDRKQFLRVVTQSAAGLAAATGWRPGAVEAAADVKPKKLEKAAIKGATDALTTFIASASLKGMPPEVVAQGKRCLIDGFGVILAGSTTQGSAIMRDYVTAAAGRREATVLGSKQVMTSASYAALANGASGHAMDYDDTQLSTTPDRMYGLLTHLTLPPLAALAVASARARRARRSWRSWSDSKWNARSQRQSIPITTSAASTARAGGAVWRAAAAVAQADLPANQAHADHRVESGERIRVNFDR